MKDYCLNSTLTMGASKSKNGNDGPFAEASAEYIGCPLQSFRADGTIHVSSFPRSSSMWATRIIDPQSRRTAKISGCYHGYGSFKSE